jgi:trehalose-6-phosphatase
MSHGGFSKKECMAPAYASGYFTLEEISNYFRVSTATVIGACGAVVRKKLDKKWRADEQEHPMTRRLEITSK